MMAKGLLEVFYRLAATGWVPRSFFAPALPAVARNKTVSDPGRPLSLEIVSHCWRYAHMLTYQISSLIIHPPRQVQVRLTVYYSREDIETVRLLEWAGSQKVPSVTWNWVDLEKTHLFRRCIGRNMAARATEADWIWFTDCDVVFHDGGVDNAGKVLRGRDDFLVFPGETRVTGLLKDDDPMFETARQCLATGQLRLLDIDPARFVPEFRDRAIGPFQIVRGDVARAGGYCGTIGFYQRPLPRWQKAYEDRTFRWLLGTQGTSTSIPGLYRIRHHAKGRKTG
ncbi:MAG: glycosyltransferase family 2 protein [bacterium]